LKNSNEKGAAFERLVCEKLSLWQSSMRRRDLFWRSAMSGGRATLATRRGNASEFAGSGGDVTAIDPEGEPFIKLFIVECKTWKDLGLARIVYGKEKTDLLKAWEKVRAEDPLRIPLLIAKQNRQPILVMTDIAGSEKIVTVNPLIRVCAEFPEYDMTVFKFEDILLLDPEEMVK